MTPGYLDLKIGGNSVIDVIPGSVSVTQELNRHWWCNLRERRVLAMASRSEHHSLHADP